ncbi:MAG: gas vesicle protein GvpG [Planctomycetes bacterium]|uniref:hypothetical protein n=1 Tax=Candidatus Tripitaka californicus TaxID=3367616 RepID=UPI004028E8A4|nr:gas vesicle protein GvpG [Planctomycetota bacterium]
MSLRRINPGGPTAGLPARKGKAHQPTVYFRTPLRGWRKTMMYINSGLVCTNIGLAIWIAILLTIPLPETLSHTGGVGSAPLPPTLQAPTEKLTPTLNKYDPVTEHNLFSNTRTDWAVAVSDKEGSAKTPNSTSRGAAPPVSIDKFILYGTATIGGKKKALISHPSPAPGQNPILTVKEGDEVAGYLVRRIEEKQITLEKGKEEFVVKLLPGAQAGQALGAKAPTPGAVGQSPSVAAEASKPGEKGISKESLYNRLFELDTLLEEGKISQEEYDKREEEVLEKLKVFEDKP